MSLETETQHETTAFEHFDREWTIPTKRHLSHIKKMRDEVRAGTYGNYNLLVTETMLSAEQFDALLAIDPDEDALEGFVGAIVDAMGVGNSGNSGPSSTSS